MSELTPCNYCSLRRIKARAKKKGNVVTTAVSTTRGKDILVHPKHVPAKDARANRKKYRVVCLLRLTNACCC